MTRMESGGLGMNQEIDIPILCTSFDDHDSDAFRVQVQEDLYIISFFKLFFASCTEAKYYIFLILIVVELIRRAKIYQFLN